MPVNQPTKEQIDRRDSIVKATGCTRAYALQQVMREDEAAADKARAEVEKTKAPAAKPIAETTPEATSPKPQ